MKYPAEKRVTALSVVGDKSPNKSSTSTTTQTSPLRPTIITGLNIRCRTAAKSKFKQTVESVESLNDQNRNDLSPLHIMEVDPNPELNENSCLYLVVYDFLYTKEPNETENIQDENQPEPDSTTINDAYKKIWNFPAFSSINESDLVNDEMSFVSNYSLLKHQLSMYQNLIPGESDEIFLPPPTNKPHTGPRLLPVEVQATETDSAQATSLIIQPCYSFMNGQLENTSSDKSISDHIADLKSSFKSRNKLNYSKAVQCISLPEQYKKRRDLDVTDINPTHEGGHVVVVLKSEDERRSVLLLYALDFSGKMVRINEEPMLVRELDEKPVEVSVLPQLDRTIDASRGICAEGTLLLVCADGAVRLLDLTTFKTLSVAKLENEKFVSAAYCNSKYTPPLRRFNLTAFFFFLA